METLTPPIPKNEMERILALSEFDLDYTDLKEPFKDLVKLAAKVAGTQISLVNLIDSFTQWTISDYNLPVEQMDREDSVCQYTIMQEESFEVKNLAEDDRFKDKFYVKGQPNIRYYYGIPLKTDKGQNIGALCVLDYERREISPEKVEMLKIIANEVIKRLASQKAIQLLKTRADEAAKAKLTIAHDVRGPLSGIMSLAEIICQQGDQNKLEDVLQFISLIQKSSHSLLELANEILTSNELQNKALQSNEMNLVVFKEKLEKLYTPQALNKKIDFAVDISGQSRYVPFNKNKLLQITGNLISNAIKFTTQGGKVKVTLQLLVNAPEPNVLSISVKDTGMGLTDAQIEDILTGKSTSTNGTEGENGYGFGLSLVRHLIESLKGELKIFSDPDKGTCFVVKLPQI